uniref:Uncharacterized protein n=1 Tax=Plectus sambesii TaxID=2011161 RepID=A0A914X798_9BILA
MRARHVLRIYLKEGRVLGASLSSRVGSASCFASGAISNEGSEKTRLFVHACTPKPREKMPTLNVRRTVIAISRGESARLERNGGGYMLILLIVAFSALFLSPHSHD